MDFNLTLSHLENLRFGAHFILCNTNKAATYDWKTRPRGAVSAHSHWQQGGLIGVIPASIGLCVIDIDYGGLEAVQTVQERLGLRSDQCASGQSSSPDRYHLWFRATSKQPNRKWSLKNKDGDLIGAGEIRGSNGYIIFWCLDLICALHKDNTKRWSPVSIDPLFLSERSFPASSDTEGPLQLPALNDVIQTLNRIDPDVEYEDWIRCLMALHWYSDKTGCYTKT